MSTCCNLPVRAAEQTTLRPNLKTRAELPLESLINVIFNSWVNIISREALAVWFDATCHCCETLAVSACVARVLPTSCQHFFFFLKIIACNPSEEPRARENEVIFFDIQPVIDTRCICSKHCQQPWLSRPSHCWRERELQAGFLSRTNTGYPSDQMYVSPYQSINQL